MAISPKREYLDENAEAAALVHPKLVSSLVNPANTVLDYSNSYLGDDKFGEIIEKARRASVPTRLDLRGNCFEAGAARALATLLRSSHNVVAISLEWNNVGLLDQGVEALAGALEVDNRLLILDLRNNNIGPEGAKALAKALRVNRTLRQLDLRWNEIGNPGVLAFREALQSNYALVTLELMGNNSSLKHVDEIEVLLARNRAFTERPPPLAVDVSCQNGGANKESPKAAPDDQLLLQVLAEKVELETAVSLGKRERQKMIEKTEELELQLQQVRKDTEMAKEERDRYQQREIDAKRDAHELRMQLDELENRRKLEFEEYRSARTALERENAVTRDKMGHMEALRSKEAEQKDKQISQLEEVKYTLDNEMHRTSLTIRAQEEEIGKLHKQLQDTQQEYSRKEAKLVSDHEGKLSAAQRQHDMVTGSIQTQLSYTSAQLEASERSVRELKDKCEALQAKMLQSQIDHEKSIGDLKQHWEAEMQERIQRSVGSVEAQVAEVKKARQQLEREVEKHLETIIQLRQDNISLLQAKDEQQREMETAMETQAKTLQEEQTLLAAAVSERSRIEEKLRLQLRKMEEQDARLVQMQANFDERIQILTSSAKIAAEESAAIMKEKAALIASLEGQVLRLERELSALNHEHEKRIDNLAESFGRFVQEQMGKERERRKKTSAAPSSDV
ncbi:Leucine-rich repeat-containing protein 45 [Phytophthora nicotianae]|uniref:Leucine-rich repeat-containing protein 45 n=1 Tax=Phytophthora nicotianae TaxID=4792 RepID=A0A0W8D5L6_PHYNI|nr:Leucine-rich repeat-containing protein 45 [Phytophthora nicotianae]